MVEIERAIEKAFVQLKKKTNQNNKPGEPQEELILKNSSGLTDSSEMTLFQSVFIGQNQNKIGSSIKNQREISVQSVSYESVAMF